MEALIGLAIRGIIMTYVSVIIDLFEAAVFLVRWMYALCFDRDNYH